MEEVFAVMNLQQQQQQQQQPHAAAATLHADDVDDQIMGQAALEVEAMDNTSQAEAVDNTSHPRNGADVGGGEVGDVPETPKSTGEHITGESLGNNNRGALGGVGKMGRRVLREGCDTSITSVSSEERPTGQRNAYPRQQQQTRFGDGVS
ncbi:uncharacterized protein LOC126981265 [Eriocheir sinensis]|uniref:uncharacterized protein LOC126981265 n=1 Tax=Eriocheir sinensis TaxID=95602 RepID=UPI0021C85A70|nr:uncharacterized protein LOC126981265 [Eriocheir sinensis]